MHGIQVVNQRLHGLEGGAVGLLCRTLVGELLAVFRQSWVHHLAQAFGFLFPIAIVISQDGVQAGFLLDGVHHPFDGLLGVFHAAQQFTGFCQVFTVQLTEGLYHPVGHPIVEVRDALAAMLVVLVGLDGNAPQGGIALDVIGLPQETVAGGKTAAEQLFNVNLATGGGQSVEVHVVDVDIPIYVGFGIRRVEDVHLTELLGALGPILQHGAHGGVPVDVGILPLDVVVLRVLEGQIFIDLHQLRVHLPHPGALGAVQDVLLGGAAVAIFDQGVFYGVLNLFHGGLYLTVLLFQVEDNLMGQVLGHLVVVAPQHFRRLEDGICNLLFVEGNGSPIALHNLPDHISSSDFLFV